MKICLTASGGGHLIQLLRLLPILRGHKLFFMIPESHMKTYLKDYKTYVGYTHDLNERFKQHNSGKVKATKYRRPLELLMTENFETSKEAKQKEIWWKSGVGRRKLKKLFEEGFPPS